MNVSTIFCLGLFMVLAVMSACGCAGRSGEVQLNASSPAQGEALPRSTPGEEDSGSNDPLEGYNRVMDKVNDKVNSWLLFPVAKGYNAVVPESGRVAVGNFFDNLGFPARLANNLFQTKFREAGTECMRFGVNSTVGIFGLTDPAAGWLDLEPSEEDFGQTLGAYGVDAGPHIVLPLMGHTNIRDAAGGFADAVLDPFSVIDNQGAELAVDAVEGVNGASFIVDDYEEMKTATPDAYRFMRDTYEQERAMAIED